MNLGCGFAFDGHVQAASAFVTGPSRGACNRNNCFTIGVVTGLLDGED